MPNPQIVVLDGYTLNPGDLSWAGLEAFGTLTVHDRTPAQDVVQWAQSADLVLTNKALVTKEVIAALPRLRYVGVLATGYNVVDVEAAKAQGIPVTHVPSYSTDSVAQVVFGHLLHHALHVGDHAESVRRGDWSGCPDFSYTRTPLIELTGLTIGIIGYGQIGQAVARRAEAFGLQVLVHTRTPGRDPQVQFVDLETLLRQSDVVSLHCPLTSETRHLINAERLSWMKPSAFLINTSRGPVVDEVALAEVLKAGRLAGAGLDVLSTEPPPADHPLLAAPRTSITPHFAWATRAARERLLRLAVENVAAFLQGRPQNVVNG